MKTIFIFFFLQSFFVYKETFGLEISSLIETCKANDPNLNECVKAAGQKFIPQISKGISDWNLPSIDPITTDEISFEDRSNGNDLTVTYKDIVQTGFSDTLIENVDVDLEHSVMNFKLRYPFITFKADYTSTGRFLNFVVDGNGKANITVWNAFSSLGIKFHVVKDHIQLDSVMIGFSYDKIFLDYSNLMLNGDKELSDSASVFINENSKEIIDGFKPEMDKFYSKLTKDFLQELFNSVPYSSLFPKN